MYNHKTFAEIVGMVYAGFDRMKESDRMSFEDELDRMEKDLKYLIGKAVK